jgi:iduronate 2-sulfatase
MRWVIWLLVAAACASLAAQEKPNSELERVKAAAAETRKAAAAEPTIKDANSPPVKAYLAEQQRRRLMRLAGLRQRIDQYQGDPSKQNLVPTLKQQLADLESKPPEQVSFDSAYGYEPTTGLVGYSKKVRFLENAADGKAVILAENAALAIEGLGTSGYASGKFFGVEKAFLIGAPRPDYSFQGSNRKSYSATLVDLEPLLKTAGTAKRLNVLLIVIDDLNTELGCYGNPVVLSPNIDRLAARGVRFERAYCQYAVCAPSRQSFLSGLRPETTGIFEFQTLLRQKMPDVVFLPQLFREHGYFTAGMGKVFHDERQSDREKSWDFYDDKMRADEQEAAAVKERYSHPEGQRPFTPWTKLTGPEENTRDGSTSRRIAQHMSECNHEGKPFFVAAGFHKPHLPWTAPTKYFDLYRNRPIAEPHDPPIRGIPPLALMTELVGNPSPPRAEAISTYYSCISFMDAQVGVLLDTLDREKLWEDTVVVLFSDHGYHLGDHDGLWAKLTVFDRGCRVPLVIAAPGQSKGTASPRTVELIDVYPTLAELCGLPPPSKLEGRSLAPLLKQPDAGWERPAHSLVHHNDSVGKSVVSERWRYTEWDGGKQGIELYDHEADPGEYRNLAGDPQHAATAAEMKRLLLP